MTIQDLLDNIGDIDSLILTGICDKNRCAFLVDQLQPTSVEARGTLIDIGANRLDVAYTFCVFGEREAAKGLSDVDVVYIGNHYDAKPAYELLDAWLPVIKPGGYLICFDHYADADAELTQVDENTTDHPPNWYRQA